MACLKCGGSGFMCGNIPCDCGAKSPLIVPENLHVPSTYQSIRFNKELLPYGMHISYGAYMESLIKTCTSNIATFRQNILICSPPNSGKTVFAYTVIGMLFAKGVTMPELMDIMEVRNLLMSIYNVDQEKVKLLSTAPLAIIKLPMDLPPKFAETMSTIIERRVRHNGSTIFLYGGTKDDLLAQDTFGRLRSLLNDGSYNSIAVKSWKGA